MIQMNMKKAIAVLAVASSTLVSASAQYAADVNIGPDFSNTLFSQGTTPAPVNTIVWFVASVDSQLGTFGANTTLTPDQLIGPDDTLVRQVKTDGAAGSYGPGYYIDTLTGIAAANASRNIFLVLFGNQQTGGTPNLTPSGGETFGFASLGVRTVPALGNADWSPLAPVLGNTHQIVAVPEPATYLLSMLGVAGLIGYRRFRK